MSVPFTPNQQRAVAVLEDPLDTCIVAGPGSGKTTVLVEYFRRLVESGVDPVRILAITFTEKAAGNMRKKLAGAFQHDSALRARLERAWVSTVHGFCARLLRENAVFAGIDPEFQVADERQAWRLQHDSMAAAIEELYGARPAEVRALLAGIAAPGYPMDALETALLNAYDAMRGAGVPVTRLGNYTAEPPVTLERVLFAIREIREENAAGWNAGQRAHLAEVHEAMDAVTRAARGEDVAGVLRAVHALRGIPKLNQLKSGSRIRTLVKELRDTLAHDVEYLLIQRLYARERDLLIEIVARFDGAYRERKRQAGVVDFADLEEFTVRLLEDNPAARERLRAQFDHVLMDEFQDTNGQQALLLELIRPDGRFYAVGDINQSIFGFRHAEPSVFGRYRDGIEAGGGRLVHLTDNFRSRAQILAAVETVANGAPGVEPRPLVAGREFASEPWIAVEWIACTAADSAAAMELEARWVAHRILELAGEGREHAFRDIAVLVRNTEVLRDLTEAFDRAGIPHVVNRGRGFYGTREVADLTHLLRTIANPRDEISLAAVLRSPFAGVSDEALLALRGEGRNLGEALLRLADDREDRFSSGDWRRLRRFRGLLEGWRRRRYAHTFDRLLLNAIDECAYRFESGARGAANVDKFLAEARAAASRMTIDRFIEELALVRAEDPREPDAPPEDSSDTVKLMTVHSAKGLEFPVVFVAGLQKGVRGETAVVDLSRHGLGASWKHPASGDGKTDLHQHAIRDERRRREEEESSRLLYVAMTRAEDRLILTCSSGGRKPENWAGAVAQALGIDLSQPREETLDMTAPDGEPWRLGLLVTADPPPAGARPARAAEEPAIETADPPAVAGQHDSNATVTDLTLFAACPRRYYLGRYLGWEGRVRALPEGGVERGPSAGELGTEVHAILAGNPPSDPDPEAEALADVFRRSALGRRAGRARRVERETDFVMALGDLVVRGQIDLWFEEGGELIVVDYKTDDVTAHRAHERALDYAVQLRLYAMALERLAGRAPDRAWLYFLRPDTAVEIDLAPSLLESPERAAADLLEAQDRLEFPVRTGEHCKRCPFYRDLCPADISA